MQQLENTCEITLLLWKNPEGTKDNLIQLNFHNDFLGSQIAYILI